jgi:ATP-binding cassette subfamily B protein RaxB
VNLRESLHIGWGRQLPLVLQTEAAECALACLAMIASYHGNRSDLVDLRRRYGMSLRGATLQDVVRIADHLGLTSRPLRIELEELPMLRTPCILHWDFIHFVVLKSASRNDIVIHDPAVGVRRLTNDQVSKHFTGVALELTPAQGFQPNTAAPRVRMTSMLGNLVGLKRSLGELFVLALAMEVFAIASPLFLQWVVDHVLVTADHDLLLVLALGFTLLLLIRVTVSAMRGSMLIAFGAQLKVQGRANLFTHLVNLPTRFFEMRYIGDVMSRFGSQDTILQAISTDVIEALLDGLMATGTLIVMFIFAPLLAAVVLVGAALYGIVRWASYTPLRQASAEAIMWSARRDSHFLETLRGIRTIKLFNGQDGRRNHWLNLLVEATNRQLTTQKMQLVYRTANSLVVGALAILVVWMGANRVLANTLSVGMLLAFISYKDQFLDRVSSLINKVLDLQMLRLHAERLADLALTAPEPRDHVPAPDDGWVRPASIEVRNLRFRYGESDPWVLDGIDCRFEVGEFVAIVGPSGCGKTTLLKVLASLFEPTEGELQVNGAPLAHIGVERYRAMIGVVMQDDQLFAGSIADNICFFAEQPDQERIMACARQAAVHDDIMDMAMGYNTLIGDMGTVLSGGQKQRVLIARALYRQPGVLMLDEATSHLDVGREKAVSDALRASRVTRIIVAHRPETIMSADRVVTLEGGKIASDRRKAEAGERLLASVPPLLSDGSVPPVSAPVTSPPSSPSSAEKGSERNAAG